MSAAFSVEQIATEWKANPRLRLGVYVIVAIAWLYAILLMRDFAIRERANWEAIEAQNQRAKTTAAEADWATRAQDMKRAVEDLESLLWREGSSGLSQAAFQEAGAQRFAQAGVLVRSNRGATPTESNAAPAVAGLLQLRARAQVEFRPSTFYPWLAAFARARAEKTPAIAIDSLVIRTGGPGQAATAEIELVGYAIRPNIAAVDGSPPGSVSTPARAGRQP
jgi:hypothetical protein